MLEEKAKENFRSIINSIKNEIRTTKIKVAIEKNKSLINRRSFILNIKMINLCNTSLHNFPEFHKILIIG